MGHTIKRFEEGQLVIAAFEGLVEGRNLLAALDEIEGIATASALPRLVWDSRLTTCLAIGPSQLDRIIAHANAMQARLGPGRTAFVAARGVDSDLAAMFIESTQDSPRERSIFSEMDAALAWLFERAALASHRTSHSGASLAHGPREDQGSTPHALRIEDD